MELSNDELSQALSRSFNVSTPDTPAIGPEVYASLDLARSFVEANGPDSAKKLVGSMNYSILAEFFGAARFHKIKYVDVVNALKTQMGIVGVRQILIDGKAEDAALPILTNARPYPRLVTFDIHVV